MARIVVHCVVAGDPPRFRRTIQHLKKNAGIDFDLWVSLASDDPTLRLEAEATDPARLFAYDRPRLSWAVCQNLALDALDQDLPDYVLLLDPDLDIHSRRFLKKLLRVATKTGQMVQPRIVGGYKQRKLAEDDVGDVVDFPDPRCLLVPYEALVGFRFDHFGALASHDEHRLATHMVHKRRVVTVRQTAVRTKHCGSGYRYLEEKDGPDIAMEAKKVMSYAG